jgi:hypothetical protein
VDLRADQPNAHVDLMALDRESTIESRDFALVRFQWVGAVAPLAVEVRR